RLSNPVGFDRTIIQTAAKVIKLQTPSTEAVGDFGQRISLKILTRVDTQTPEFICALGSDAPELAHGEFIHECLHLVRQNGELSVRFPPIARDLCEHFVRCDAGGARKTR